MKRVVVVLAACGSKDAPPEKLGSDDIVQADRIPVPKPGELAPLS